MIPTRARAYDTKPAPSGTISGRNLPTVGAVTTENGPRLTTEGLTTTTVGSRKWL